MIYSAARGERGPGYGICSSASLQEGTRAFMFQTMASARQDQRVTLGELTGQLVIGHVTSCLAV